MSKEAMKLALEALECTEYPQDHYDAITALREALASEAIGQPANQVDDIDVVDIPAQQEPVAWGIIASNTGRICQVELDADEIQGHNPKYIVPLYTSPPAQRKPLTDKEIERIYDRYGGNMMNCTRAIERARGIYAPTELKENT